MVCVSLISGAVVKAGIDLRDKHPKETFHDFFNRKLDRSEGCVKFIHDQVDISCATERKIGKKDVVMMVKLTSHPMRFYLVWKLALWTVPTTVPVYMDDTIHDIMERAEDVVLTSKDFEGPLDFAVEIFFTPRLIFSSKIFRPPFDVSESVYLDEKLGIDEDASIVISVDDDKIFVVIGDVGNIMQYVRCTRDASGITPPWEDDNWDRSETSSTNDEP
jgi:hypothetical protein